MVKMIWKTTKLGLAAMGAMLILSSNAIGMETPQPTRLSAGEVTEQIQQLPGWMTDGEQIYCTYQFENFVEAIAFVNGLVEPAEAAGHHPDIAISYNKVMLSLTTHDAGGLTAQDFALAQQIAQLSNSSDGNRCQSVDSP